MKERGEKEGGLEEKGKEEKRGGGGGWPGGEGENVEGRREGKGLKGGFLSIVGIEESLGLSECLSFGRSVFGI